MPTKAQAIAAINSASTDAIADINNIIPVGANIKDGHISFGPTRYLIVLDAGGLVATADSLLVTVKANLDAVPRTYITPIRRRKTDVKNQYVVIEAKLTVRIVNF